MPPGAWAAAGSVRQHVLPARWKDWASPGSGSHWRNRPPPRQRNFQYSRPLVEDGATVGVVTSNFHIFRSLLLAKSAGFTQVCGIAAPLWRMDASTLHGAGIYDVYGRKFSEEMCYDGISAKEKEATSKTAFIRKGEFYGNTTQWRREGTDRENGTSSGDPLRGKIHCRAFSDQSGTV